MKALSASMAADDGVCIHVRSWLPDGVRALGDPARPGDPLPRAVIQIAHGLAEHSARYERFATAAVEAGFAVHANDHRGHGKSVVRPEDKGFFAAKNGWEAVVDDLDAMLRLERAAYPDVPVFLLGHSLGSFLGRDLAAKHGDELAGLILTGTGTGPGAAGYAAMAFVRGQELLKGPRHLSGTLDQLMFGGYNSYFVPSRTSFDWLSRDEAEVDAYLMDPMCGFICTASLYDDVLKGTIAVGSPKVIGRTPVDLPILIASGELDPVGGQGRGVREVAAAYRKAGVKDVTMTLYPQARHEILNEINRDEVTADLLGWVNAHLPAAQPS
ncbi:Esterase/lipase [Actinomyces bovis]|uniref:Esterase/lipase n=1 Tax=Actinomyces bovis TaxID=1658 RepID=A0ABY1VND4_9ACTO|nr:alpha/beta fold hydrolase [Actinomyces bovis]SPT53207.1 Esterase/lipase [Actinomyces bovis]VEG52431.1 Esterase/lipase [Actinomyces israelii]